MLKNVDPLLTPDLLWVLRSMGHGDEIVLVDQNFPAYTITQARGRKLVDLSGIHLDSAARAILSVLPVDRFVEPAVFRMRAVGQEDRELPVHQEFGAIVDEAEGRHVEMGTMERFEFYERARSATALVLTGDDRAYGCFIVVKGVVWTAAALPD